MLRRKDSPGKPYSLQRLARIALAAVVTFCAFLLSAGWSRTALISIAHEAPTMITLIMEATSISIRVIPD